MNGKVHGGKPPGNWPMVSSWQSLTFLVGIQNYLHSAPLITVMPFQCIMEKKPNGGACTLNSQKWK